MIEPVVLLAVLPKSLPNVVPWTKIQISLQPLSPLLNKSLRRRRQARIPTNLPKYTPTSSVKPRHPQPMLYLLRYMAG